ncbi:MAG TPA: alpha/beta fold hydrolase [Solirubrobacteraceae bacterium]|nr:alpha/beta fold hydrolase [Solirubrobacteraceae bacterium]
MPRSARRRRRVYPPLPPRPLPPARTVVVPDRGEFFLRDTGGDGPPVLLLHGWLVSADLNWCGAYDALARAGYRVLALDHRGHGRGLRAMAPFRLTDCAADAAAVLRQLGAFPATVVGYSMGGVIAQLVARDHRDVTGGLVLSATCQHFQDPETRRVWRWMGLVGLMLGLAPRQFYLAGFRRQGIRLDERTAWWLAELMRHESRDVAEAGRELGRFDSRPWLHAMAPVPSAMVLTTRDTAVAPVKQRELAEAVGATVFEVSIDHLDVATRIDEYNPALLEAVASVGAREAAVSAHG